LYTQLFYRQYTTTVPIATVSTTFSSSSSQEQQQP